MLDTTGHYPTVKPMPFDGVYAIVGHAMTFEAHLNDRSYRIWCRIIQAFARSNESITFDLKGGDAVYLYCLNSSLSVFQQATFHRQFFTHLSARLVSSSFQVPSKGLVSIFRRTFDDKSASKMKICKLLIDESHTALQLHVSVTLESGIMKTYKLALGEPPVARDSYSLIRNVESLYACRDQLSMPASLFKNRCLDVFSPYAKEIGYNFACETRSRAVIVTGSSTSAEVKGDPDSVRTNLRTNVNIPIEQFDMISMDKGLSFKHKFKELKALVALAESLHSSASVHAVLRQGPEGDAAMYWCIRDIPYKVDILFKFNIVGYDRESITGRRVEHNPAAHDELALDSHMPPVSEGPSQLHAQQFAELERAQHYFHEDSFGLPRPRNSADDQTMTVTQTQEGELFVAQASEHAATGSVTWRTEATASPEPVNEIGPTQPPDDKVRGIFE